MAWTFNPFTGNFDQKGSGGGGGSAFFAGEVATYADLPLDGTAALDSRWLVRSNSGTWPFSSYKQAGVYVRKATGGTDRDADYQLTDTSFFDVMSDNKFLVFDNSDATKAMAFDVGTNVPTSSTVTLTVPASSGTIALTSDLPTSGTKTYAVFTATDNQPPASNYATLDTRNSIAVLDFDAVTDESAVFVGIIPEGASLGSGLKVRLHWMATSATSGNCRWGVQFEKAGTDLDSDSFDTATEAHSAANGTSGIETVTEITITTIDSLAAGDRFRLKVFRNADDATNDTMTGDAELIAVEIRSAA
jgi:hypothetical protein